MEIKAKISIEETMDAENAALNAAVLKEDEEEVKTINLGEGSNDMFPPPWPANDDDSGWTTVTLYAKRNKMMEMMKQQQQTPERQNSGDSGLLGLNDVAGKDVDVKDESDKADEAAAVVVEAAAGENSSEQNQNSNTTNTADYHADANTSRNDEHEEEKKVSFREAAEKFDASDFAAFLRDISITYDKQPNERLMRFAKYFERLLASVTGRLFPWLHDYNDCLVQELIDYPLEQIPINICNTAFDWIDQQPMDALGSFVLSLIDSIHPDISRPRTCGETWKCNTKAGILVALGLTLRQKPDALCDLVPILNDNPIFKERDQSIFMAWAVCQVYPTDPAITLYLWSHLLVPKMKDNPRYSDRRSRMWILDIADRILSNKETFTMLLNTPVRKGKRLVTPFALAHFVNASYLSADNESLARTLEFMHRAEYGYRHYTGDVSFKDYKFDGCDFRPDVMDDMRRVCKKVKKIALAGSLGSEEMKQVAEELFKHVLEVAGRVSKREGQFPLSKEANKLLRWCSTNNPECYKQWDMLYLDYIKGSVVILKRLSMEPRKKLLKHVSPNLLKRTLKSFRKKNAAALRCKDEAERWGLFKDAEKWGKVLQVRLSLCCGHALCCVVFSIVMVCSTTLIAHKLNSWGTKIARRFKSAEESLGSDQ